MRTLLEIVNKTLDDRQAMDIVCIDTRSVNPFIDYYYVCSSRNSRMARSIIEELEDEAIKEGYEVVFADKGDSQWRIIDLGSIIVHVFYDGAREYYDLEGLWKDLPRLPV